MQAASQRGKEQHYDRGRHQHDGDHPGRPFGCGRDVKGPKQVVRVQPACSCRFMDGSVWSPTSHHVATGIATTSATAASAAHHVGRLPAACSGPSRSWRSPSCRRHRRWCPGAWGSASGRMPIRGWVFCAAARRSRRQGLHPSRPPRSGQHQADQQSGQRVYRGSPSATKQGCAQVQMGAFGSAGYRLTWQEGGCPVVRRT
jgi:hypothetical protein